MTDFAPPPLDPLMCAGRLTCDTCGRVAYADDAVWIADLILATFPPSCEHARGAAWLVEPSELEPSPWCGVTTKAGDPCRNRAPEPGRACHVHDPVRRRQKGRL